MSKRSSIGPARKALALVLAGVLTTSAGHAVANGRVTALPACTLHVDAESAVEADGFGPITSAIGHIAHVFAKTPDCGAPGAGVFVDTYEDVAPDSYSFTNSIFWGNAKDGDSVTACNSSCDDLKVSVDSSMMQTINADGSIKISFGTQDMAPADPQFAMPNKAGFFRLKPSSPAAGLGALHGIAAAAEAEAIPPAMEELGALPPPPAKQTISIRRAIARGGMFLGFKERFNRYYTDRAWTPSRVVYVSPAGGGNGAGPGTPLNPEMAIATAAPGTMIYFLRGDYTGGWELPKELSGTYGNPIVLFGEAGASGHIGVRVDCNAGERKTCINLEGADNVAVQGFEFVGGNYGVRVVGLGFDASQHSRGIAIIGNIGHGQNRDPFFSAQSDWNVWEDNLAYDAKEDDGHGFYISNGSDWNIVRYNETHSNASSNFQVNADPASTCAEDGIAFDESRCDAYAGEGEGGRGASDYFLVENNYFHHDAVGPNFTSLRRSVVRNNVFGLQARHNVSFWQETDNPRLGSSDNLILHNLFIATHRHGIQFANRSAGNTFANNVILGVAVENGITIADPEALLLEVVEPGGENFFSSNFYGSGKFTGHAPGGDEIVLQGFSADWFTMFPTTAADNVQGYMPSAQSPYLAKGKMLADAAEDRNGVVRSGSVDLGPYEIP